MKVTIEDENDLWKLFSDAPDQPGNRVRTFDNELNIVLKSKIKLTDTTRFYHLFPGGLSVPDYALWTGTGSSAQAIVTQANLRTVGRAMVRKFTDVAVQYLGPLPGNEAA